MMEEGHIFKGITQPIELRLGDLVEPNYGRMRWTFELVRDGHRVLNDFIGVNSYLLPDLEQLEFLSESEEHAFLPLEGRCLAIHLDTMTYQGLIPHEMGNNDFVGNHFSGEYLVVNHRREIQIHHLDKVKTERVVFASGQYLIIDSSFSVSDGLWITYKDLQSYEVRQNKYDLAREAWAKTEMS